MDTGLSIGHVMVSLPRYGIVFAGRCLAGVTNDIFLRYLNIFRSGCLPPTSRPCPCSPRI